MSTILDVAKLAGVSTATVSRVINSPETVRVETREKVVRAMKMCNYKYNALARGFVTKQSNTIGLIIPTINNPVFAESTRGVQDFADLKKTQVILGNTYYQYKQEESLVETLREKQVDGLIITTTNLKGIILKTLLDEGFPFVLLYSTVKTGPLSAVGIDNYQGGYRATEHLVKFGHERIGMVAGNFSISDRSLHRWYGYRQCLKNNGIPYDKDLLAQTDYSLTGGRDSVKQLLSLQNPPTAVFCSNDYLAFGAMKGARELGLNLPEDLSIVGFDDVQIASYVVPGLTTIHQPAYEMGKMGTKLLFQRIKGQAKPVQLMMESSLIVRESTIWAPG
ncbi:MAG: LacI family transcriptional regulator [Desulfobacula sp.]|uniref:LacI family DNA-binding transcriptional regulator n=1 Tax=Desulfobacula sp. TaxID=2593537 RepID=UPI0025C67006|nr:LacI family DNA-binding transcriptional regulator [Desulfobacula sp.]MCD4720131.1 LacI family transcriptional regulator [Desulfobacula sp.]